jgi:hypothetical protein
MASARSNLIDVSSITILGICPLCDYRELGEEEALVRRSLLLHFTYRHDVEASIYRETQRRWFHRKGLAA